MLGFRLIPLSVVMTSVLGGTARDDDFSSHGLEIDGVISGEHIGYSAD